MPTDRNRRQTAARRLGSRAAEPESLKDRTQKSLDEARMVLPGIQALFGFQLIAVFNDRFNALEPPRRLGHFVALLLVVVTIVLLMAPAAYDRILERDLVSARFIRMTARLLAAGLAVLAISVSLELVVVAKLVIDRWDVAWIVAVVVLAGFAYTWFYVPWRARSRRYGAHA